METARGYFLLALISALVVGGLYWLNSFESMQSPLWGVGVMFSIASAAFFVVKALGAVRGGSN